MFADQIPRNKKYKKMKRNWVILDRCQSTKWGF